VALGRALSFPTECKTDNPSLLNVSIADSITLFIATEPWDPPITNIKGVSAAKPSRTFAVRRDTAQSDCESLNA
jgi:hypothetical protein